MAANPGVIRRPAARRWRGVLAFLPFALMFLAVAATFAGCGGGGGDDGGGSPTPTPTPSGGPFSPTPTPTPTPTPSPGTTGGGNTTGGTLGPGSIDLTIQ